MTASAPPSPVPRREPGTRTRAGNAMARTRSAVLEGAGRAVEKHGTRRATMGDIATLSAVAKATLYNHFRAKDDVYAALVESEVAALGEECAVVAAVDGLVAGLERAAERLSGHAALRRVAETEPAVLARLVSPNDGTLWSYVRAEVERGLLAGGAPHDAAAVDTVLRWLVSHVAMPGGAEEIDHGARTLARGLGRLVSCAGPGQGEGHDRT